MTKQVKRVHEKVKLIERFYKEFGRDPKYNEEYNGIKIGNFLHNIRSRKIKISDEDRKALKELGVRLVSKDMQQLVHEKVKLIERFYKEFGREPKYNEEYNGVKIGIFLGSVRVGNTKLTKEDETFLRKIGIKITKGIVQERVHEKVILLGKFYQEYGREPKQREEYCDVKIGTFLRSVRIGRTSIIEEDKKFLKNSGIKL